jgi:urease accessory protein
LNDWLLWQLADSAFPTGGYAHSLGLEAAWHHGEVRQAGELVSFIEATLQQLGHAVLPFLTAAYDEPGRLEELDALCDAFTTNHVANRASRLQGRAWRSALARIFALEKGPGLTGSFPSPHGHFAPLFGASMQHLHAPRVTAIRLLFFQQLRGVLAAAVRLNIVGPIEAQRLQHQLAGPVDKIIDTCQSLALDDLAQTAPLLDLWQGAHDRLYSRLFQS